MNIFLWVLQILAALMFIVHARLMFTPESLQARRLPYIGQIPAPFRMVAAVAEGLAAQG